MRIRIDSEHWGLVFGALLLVGISSDVVGAVKWERVNPKPSGAHWDTVFHVGDRWVINGGGQTLVTRDFEVYEHGLPRLWNLRFADETLMGFSFDGVYRAKDDLKWERVLETSGLRDIRRLGERWLVYATLEGAAGDRVFSSGDGREWSEHRLRTAEEISDMGFANGQWFVVGGSYEASEGKERGYILLSPDGVRWERVTPPWNGIVRRLVHVFDRWVAILSVRDPEDHYNFIETLLVTKDFEQWERIDRDIEELLVFDEALLGMDGGRILRSENLMDWELVLRTGAQNHFPPGRALIDSHFFRGGLFLVSEPNKIHRTANGKDWETVLIPNAFLGDSKMWEAGEHLFVTSYNGTYRSADGQSWETMPEFENEFLQTVAFGSGVLVAAGAGSLLTSSDGQEWEQHISGFTLSTINVIAHDEKGWLAGTSDGELFRSKDGIAWDAIEYSRPSLIQSAGQGDTQWAFGAANHVLFLEEDDTIRSVRAGPGAFQDLHFGDGLWVGVGNRIRTLTDELQWRVARGTPEGSFDEVTWGNARWIVAGNWNGAYTSVDGIAWNRMDIPRLETIDMVRFRGDEWLLAGRTRSEGEIPPVTFWRSNDGVDWRPEIVKEARSLVDIEFGDGTWVAVGWDGQVATSVWGGPWQLQHLPANLLNNVHYANGLWRAVGSSIFVSADGLEWEVEHVNQGPALSHLAFAQGQWIAAGSEGQVYLLDSKDETSGHGFGAQRWVGERIAGGGSNSFASLVVADFDGDGDLDVAGASGRKGTLYVNEEKLREGQELFSGNGFQSLETLDMEGDGDPDLVSFEAGEPSRIRFWMNDGKGGFEANHELLSSAAGANLAVGDIDDDGDFDVVFSKIDRIGPPENLQFGFGVVTIRNDGSGTFTFETPLFENLPYPAFEAPLVELADMDGDSHLDLVLGGLETRIYLNDGQGVFRKRVRGTNQQHGVFILTVAFGREMAVGDIDGDGDKDVVVGFPNQPNRLFVNEGEDGFSFSQSKEVGGWSWITELVDLNGDGREELLTGVRTPQQDLSGLFLWEQEGDVSDLPRPFYPIGFRNESVAIAHGDLNGDGVPDFVMATDRGIEFWRSTQEHVPRPEPDELIAIRDPVLERMIRQTLRWPPEKPLLKSEIESISELVLVADRSREAFVSSLEGMEHWVGLERLSLRGVREHAPGGGLTDVPLLEEISLEPLAGLSRLRVLDLSNNRLERVSVPESLGGLDRVILFGNPLTKVSVPNIRTVDHHEGIIDPKSMGRTNDGQPRIWVKSWGLIEVQRSFDLRAWEVIDVDDYWGGRFFVDREYRGDGPVFYRTRGRSF